VFVYEVRAHILFTHPSHAIMIGSGSSTHEHIISISCIQCKAFRRIPCPPLPERNQTGDGERADTEKPTDSERNIEVDEMQVEHGEVLGIAGSPSSLRRKRHKRNAKRPPLSLQTDAGHLVFVGKEIIKGS
jgi:hypothetical protein